MRVFDGSGGQGVLHLIETLRRWLNSGEDEMTAGVHPAAQQMRARLVAAGGAVVLHDPESQTLIVLRMSEHVSRVGEQGQEHPPFPFALLDDGSSIPAPGDLDAVVLGETTDWEQFGSGAHMSVPLEVSGERRGASVALCQQAGAFSQRERESFEGLARQVSQWLERATGVRQQHPSSKDVVPSQHPQPLAAEAAMTILAHELRNYLTPLKMRLQQVERRARRDERARDTRDLGIALASLARCDRLISDLLDVARFKQDLFSIVSSLLNLVELVQETSQAFQLPRVPIHVQTQEPVLLVLADPDRLRQVFENLFSNAITHAPEQTPVEVHIRSEERQKGNWVQVQVRNQGAGIPSEVQAQLFDPFVAGAASKGLGLGLYLAARITQAHGGELSVAASPEAGTVFTCSLPLQTEGAAGPLV